MFPTRSVLVLLGLGAATAAHADFRNNDVVGTYLGTCQAWYERSRANPCQMTMTVDQGNYVVVYGDSSCISPTDFTGVLFDDAADLESGAWPAQPDGQTLALTFNYAWGSGVWTASGSGYGIADDKWQYRCSFRQQ